MARQMLTIMKCGNNNEDMGYLHSAVTISYLPIHGGHLECYCFEAYYGMPKDGMHTCVGINLVFEFKYLNQFDFHNLRKTEHSQMAFQRSSSCLL